MLVLVKVEVAHVRPSPRPFFTHPNCSWARLDAGVGLQRRDVAFEGAVALLERRVLGGQLVALAQRMVVLLRRRVQEGTREHRER